MKNKTIVAAFAAGIIETVPAVWREEPLCLKDFRYTPTLEREEPEEPEPTEEPKNHT